jgi:AraC-like DNA-binding protein
MSASPNGYETSSKGRDIVMLGIRQDRLRFACSALLGLASEEIQLCDLAFNMGSKIGGPLHSLLTNALSSALAAETKNFTPIQPEQENYIIDVIARTIAPQLAMDTHSTPPAGSPREVVHMALSAFVDLEHPPSMSDLCSAAAVGETHLYECFIEVFNVSPARFIRMRRLSEARRRLLHRDAPPRSVKEVAMELGFRESGRFAHYYKATFGEQPSLTLKRVQSSSTSRQ